MGYLALTNKLYNPFNPTIKTIQLCPCAHGDLKARGFVTPEKIVAGKAFDILVDELAAANIRFEFTTEKVKALD